MAYSDYMLKVGTVKFNNPSPLRDTFKYAPELVQVGKSEVVASGKLSIKVLPHDRKKIWVELPPLTVTQYTTYWNALHSDTGGHGMFLTCEVYNEKTGNYDTDTFYHTDLEVKSIYLGGQRMIKIEPFELIGH